MVSQIPRRRLERDRSPRPESRLRVERSAGRFRRGAADVAGHAVARGVEPEVVLRPAVSGQRLLHAVQLAAFDPVKEGFGGLTVDLTPRPLTAEQASPITSRKASVCLSSMAAPPATPLPRARPRDLGRRGKAVTDRSALTRRACSALLPTTPIFESRFFSRRRRSRRQSEARLVCPLCGVLPDAQIDSFSCSSERCAEGAGPGARW